MKNRGRNFCVTLLMAQVIAATMAFPLGAHAQPKPLQLVVPFAPGGGQDLLARAFNQELGAATWIRNTHSRYQLREFMVDFWHNHFNIGKNENQIATAMLPLSVAVPAICSPAIVPLVRRV